MLINDSSVEQLDTRERPSNFSYMGVNINEKSDNTNKASARVVGAGINESGKKVRIIRVKKSVTRRQPSENGSEDGSVLGPGRYSNLTAYGEHQKNLSSFK